MDLSNIHLDPALEADIEKISRNIHETWAKQRMNEGWGYAPELDRDHKLHPCMMDYEDLPESEKEVDRATVTQTIKMLLHMGYKLEKSEQ